MSRTKIGKFAINFWRIHPLDTADEAQSRFRYLTRFIFLLSTDTLCLT